MSVSPSLVWADPPRTLFCSTTEQRDYTEFNCIDEKLRTRRIENILPIKAHEVQKDLEARGVRFITPLQLRQRSRALNISEVTQKKTGYTIKEFNRLPPTDPTIVRVKDLAKALHAAGVCGLNVKRETYNNIDIGTSDDVIRQFLCISNSESTFGRDNIGQGGRGPWGINPDHTKRGGLCHPSKATVRDSSERDVKQNDLYLNTEVIQANAECAMTLYKNNNGFSDWGRGTSWGSNRHCSKPQRDRMQFVRYIGELACCTESCKEEARKQSDGDVMDVDYQVPESNSSQETPIDI